MAAAVDPEEKKNSYLDAKSYVNDPTLEMAWAEKAVQHMEIHFNLISSIPPKQLRLTPYDDQIFDSFITEFPDFKLDIIDVEALKSEESKMKWKTFCEKFIGKVDDATFGTLVRIDCSGQYSEENTILVVRTQFLAIEIARNRKGLNDQHCNKNVDEQK